MKYSISCLIVVTLAMVGCRHQPTAMTKSNYPTVGSVERLEPALDKLIAKDAQMHQLAEGFEWAEGPVWVSHGDYLLFSDIPNNVVLKWKEGEGISQFLKPAGYTGSEPRGGEPGSNGLTLDSQGRLVLCEHGDRRVARLNTDRTKTTLANRYQGKRLNSPNDLVYKSNGDLYFTDPPYGLVGNMDDPKKELSFQGVYRLKPNGDLTLLTDQLSRPNGLAFSPDEKTLYVANSDPKQAIWMAYDVQADGTISNGRLFADVTSKVGKELGLPDGMKVDKRGNLYATGPGGVFIFAPDGKQLGQLRTGQATANCAWGNSGQYLYITADMLLLRIPVLANK
jgi:gluconolactonase